MKKNFRFNIKEKLKQIYEDFFQLFFTMKKGINETITFLGSIFKKNLWLLTPLIFILRPFFNFFKDMKELIETIFKIYVKFLITKKPKVEEPKPIREADYEFQEWMAEEGLDLRTDLEKHRDTFEILNMVLRAWERYTRPIKEFWFAATKLVKRLIISFIFITTFSICSLCVFRHLMQVDEAAFYIFDNGTNSKISNKEVYLRTFEDRFHNGYFDKIRRYIEMRLHLVFPNTFNVYDYRGIFFKVRLLTEEEYNLIFDQMVQNRKAVLRDWELNKKEIPTFMDYVKHYIDVYRRLNRDEPFNFNTAQARNKAEYLKLYANTEYESKEELDEVLFDLALEQNLFKRQEWNIWYKDKTGSNLPEFLKITPDMHHLCDEDTVLLM
jgi:hypothetical protein